MRKQLWPGSPILVKPPFLLARAVYHLNRNEPYFHVGFATKIDLTLSHNRNFKKKRHS